MRVTGLRVALTTDAVGGVWTATLDLAAGLARRGAEVRLFSLGPPPAREATEDARARGVVHRWLDAPLDWTAATLDDLARAAAAIREAAQGADVLHVHAPAFASFGADMPLVASAHSCVATWWDAVRGGPMPEDLAWRGAATQAGIARADVTLAPSAAFAADLARVYGRAGNVRVAHNGAAAPPALIAENVARSVFAAGRLWDDAKNAATLDEIAAHLPTSLEVAGALEGPNGARFHPRAIAALGRLSAHAVDARLRLRPIFVSAALYEPFGLAALEAARHGCPLVLSDLATHREIWRDAARYIAPRDAVSFARALQDLLDDPRESDALGRRAHARAASFDIERTIDAIASVYAHVRSRIHGAAA